jgi:hypothetical protein
MVIRHAGVDNGNLDGVTAGRDVPSLGGIDVMVITGLVQPPELSEPRIVRQRCRGAVDPIRLCVFDLRSRLEPANRGVD